jgi:hypothetical protein
MSNWRRHPADTTLIMALDRELPLRRRIVLDRHLDACAACRARFDAFQETARLASSVYRDRADDDPVAIGALRLRLQDRMIELASEWDCSLLFRFRRVTNAVPAVARVGLSLLFVLLVVRLTQPHVTAGDPARLSYRESLPIGHFTPGATLHVTVADVCAGGFPTRHVVSTAVRQQVLQQYQMERVEPSEYEFDFLITPQLGGVADARNLWPERYDSGVWNARVKDDLEALLPRMVCDGALELQVAQREIAGDWIAAYKKYFKTDRPVARQAGRVDDDDEILFVPAPTAPMSRSAIVTFLRPASPVMVSAELTMNDRFLTARSRNIAW